MHKSINSRVGADAQQFYSDDTLKMYWTYKSFMRGIDRVSTYIISLQQKHTDLSSAVFCPLMETVRSVSLRWDDEFSLASRTHSHHVTVMAVCSDSTYSDGP